MRVEATFSSGLTKALSGRAIGDEFTVTARARIVGAEEVLLDVTGMGEGETEVIQGDLQVRLLHEPSKGERMILAGSPSSIPHADSVRMTPFSSIRGGEGEPTRLHPIKDPELRAAFMRAQREWAKRYCPWLLEEWLDG